MRASTKMNHTSQGSYRQACLEFDAGQQQQMKKSMRRAPLLSPNLVVNQTQFSTGILACRQCRCWPSAERYVSVSVSSIGLDTLSAFTQSCVALLVHLFCCCCEPVHWHAASCHALCHCKSSLLQLDESCKSQQSSCMYIIGIP